jgi:hypothetical protein
MTEKEIQLLGFERHNDDGEGNWDTYHYYTYTVANGLEFISCASDETQDGTWWIEFFNTEPTIRFYDFSKAQSLINTLTKHIVKND